MEAKDLIARLDKLKGERKTWESHWQECADYVLPRKNDIVRKQSEGNKRGVNLFDSTGPQSAELLAGALHGMMTNPSSIWFDYTTGDPRVDEQDDVRKWLQIASRATHDVLNNSNFQTEVHEVYLDLVVPGTAAMSIEEDDETVVRFGARPISEVFVDENNRGVIDTCFRVYSWTIRQMVQEYGLDALPPKVQDQYKKDPSQKYELLAAVYPRDPSEVKPDKKLPKYLPYASQIVLIEFQAIIHESGYREFPYAVPRWSLATGEKYGRSVTMKALPEIKMANKMMETLIKGAQKTVDPPLMVPNDSFILPIKTTPGGLNYRNSGSPDEKIEPFGNDCRIDFGYQVMEDVRKRIRECYYVDQLQLQQGPQMTATEVNQRTEEKLRLLGPMLGRQQSEFLKPLITRVFFIMLRKKLIPPIPKVLQGRELNVKYSSLIAQAQRASEANNIAKTVAALGPFVQADPTIMDNINGDATARYVANLFRLPAEMLEDKNAVQKKRDARAKNQAKAQQQQDQMHAAQVANQAGQAAAQIKQAGVQQ